MSKLPVLKPQEVVARLDLHRKQSRTTQPARPDRHFVDIRSDSP